MKIIVAPKAQNDISNAANWYNEQLPGLGLRYLKYLDGFVKKIAAYPSQYRFVNSEIQVCLLRTFPYKIYFSVLNDMLIILRVRHYKQKTLQRFR